MMEDCGRTIRRMDTKYVYDSPAYGHADARARAPGRVGGLVGGAGATRVNHGRSHLDSAYVTQLKDDLMREKALCETFQQEVVQAKSSFARDKERYEARIRELERECCQLRGVASLKGVEQAIITSGDGAVGNFNPFDKAFARLEEKAKQGREKDVKPKSVENGGKNGASEKMNVLVAAMEKLQSENEELKDQLQECHLTIGQCLSAIKNLKTDTIQTCEDVEKLALGVMDFETESESALTLQEDNSECSGSVFISVSARSSVRGTSPTQQRPLAAFINCVNNLTLEQLQELESLESPDEA